MKPISLTEYIDAGEDFFPKYYYVLRELGEDAKPEDALKVMEALAGVVMKKRSDERTPLGFTKTDDSEDSAK